MRILVLFGSKSDESVYSPLISKLKQEHEVEFQVLSAHRNPDRLDVVIKTTTADIIVAGAGLAAHLPGVIASKTKLPVFGIPVDSVMGGLDALLSIQQMPFGIPVLCTSPDKMSINEFIGKWEKGDSDKEVNLIINENGRDLPHVKKELDRTMEYAEKNNLKVSISNKKSEKLFNINMVQDKKEILQDMFGIHVPLLSDTKKKSPTTALELLEWTNSGGLWVGVNNTRNALIFHQKMLSN